MPLKNRVSEKIKKYLGIIKEINLKNNISRIEKCDFLLLCRDANRGVSLNGKAYSPLLDSVQDELNSRGYTTQTVALPWSRLVGADAYGQVIAINRSYFLALLLRKAFKRNYIYRLYCRIIKAASPQKLISIGCEDSLCAAARDLGVKHAELLHGIGYARLPWGWGNKEKCFLPQEIISLDSVSTATLKELEIHGISIRQIEHPFLKRFLGSERERLPAEWLLEERREYEKEMLVSLQWGYTEGVDCKIGFKGILRNGLIPEALVEIIKKTKTTVLWRLRFHPVQLRNQKKYKLHFEMVEELSMLYPNIEWRESTQKPLPSVLERCSGHVTMISASSYEAAYMGVETLALCPTLRCGGINSNLFEDLVARGYLTKEKATEQLIFEWQKTVKKKARMLDLVTDGEPFSGQHILTLGQ